MDLFSDDARRNPFPLYEQLRRQSPALHVPQLDAWLLLDYESVKRALDDHDSFSNSLQVAGRGQPPWLIFYDPPRHARLRAIITKAFTPSAIAGLEPRIRQLSQQLLTPLIERGTFDLAAEFAVPLPMQVIAHMIGIPPGDWQTFRRWSDSILALSYDLTGGADATAGLDEYRAVTAEMAAYLPELIAQRQRRPQDDLLTRLVAAEVDGERLTPEELLGFFQLLVVGGQETTANLITTAVLSLLENPAQLALLRMQMDLLPGAIEETLRLRTPVQFVFRSTRRTVELGSQTIPAGKLALVMLGSANRDPQAFDRPNEFDIRRDPNPHLAFGRGIHFCLGAPLARLEARIALTDVLQRLPKLRLASDQPWPPRRALHVHGPTSLPVCT